MKVLGSLVTLHYDRQSISGSYILARKSNKKESVSVTFHYIEKGLKNKDNDFIRSPFKEGEFNYLIDQIFSQPAPDMSIKNDFDGLKYGRIVPFINLEKIDNRTIFGQYKSAYWGHSYENTDKGKISAGSLNIRDFYFVLYLAEDGRIFLGCQYLGNYGDYGSLSQSIMRLSGINEGIRSCSYFSDFEDLRNTVPQEVRISLSSNNPSLAAGNVFNSGSLVAFKKSGKDETFELTVRENLLSMIGRPKAQLKRQIAAMLRNNQLFSVSDEDIEDCVVTVRRIKSGGTKNVYLFGDPRRATHFHLDVDLDSEGLPVASQAREAMLKKLRDEIISKSMKEDA